MNFFKKIKESIVNFSFYDDIIRESSSKAFSYLTLFALLIGLLNATVFGVRMSYEFNVFYKHFQSSDIPNFELRNGYLSIDANNAIILGDQREIVIIDPKNEFTISDIEKYNQGIIIHSNGIIFKNFNDVQTLEFDTLGALTLSKDTFQRLMKNFISIIGVIIGIIIIIGTLLLKYFESLIASIIALIMAATSNKPLKYSQLYRICCYAITLPTLYIFILDSFRLPLSLGLKILTYFVIYGIYIYKAIDRVTVPEEETLDY